MTQKEKLLELELLCWGCSEHNTHGFGGSARTRAPRVPSSWLMALLTHESPLVSIFQFSLTWNNELIAWCCRFTWKEISHALQNSVVGTKVQKMGMTRWWNSEAVTVDLNLKSNVDSPWLDLTPATFQRKTKEKPSF